MSGSVRKEESSEQCVLFTTKSTVTSADNAERVVLEKSYVQTTEEIFFSVTQIRSENVVVAVVVVVFSLFNTVLESPLRHAISFSIKKMFLDYGCHRFYRHTELTRQAQE